MGVSANGDTDVPVSKDVGHSVSKLQRHDTAASEMTDVESQVRLETCLYLCTNAMFSCAVCLSQLSIHVTQQQSAG